MTGYRYGKQLLWMALPLLLAACGHEAEDLVTPDEGPLRITAEIGMPVTRATDTAFEEEDIIAVTQTGGSTGNYKKTGGNTWTCVSGENFATIQDNTAFTASYPVGFSAILEEQTTKEGYTNSNHLTASASSAANHLNFTFAPAGAKLIINVAYKEATAVTGLSVAGTGIRTTASSSETIKLFRVTNIGALTYHTFTGIMRATTYSGYTITLTGSDNTTKTYTHPASIELKAGHAYTYNFTYGENLVLTSVTVTDFTEVEDDKGGDVGDAT